MSKLATPSRIRTALVSLSAGLAAIGCSSGNGARGNQPDASGGPDLSPTEPSTSLPVTTVESSTSSSQRSTSTTHVGFSTVGILTNASGPLSRSKVTSECDYVQLSTFPEHSVRFTATIFSNDKTRASAQLEVVAVAPGGIARKGELTLSASGASAEKTTSITNKPRWASELPISRTITAPLDQLRSETQIGPARFEFRFDTTVDGQPVAVKAAISLSIDPASSSIVIGTADETIRVAIPGKDPACIELQ